MIDTRDLRTRVSPQMKARVHALAEQQFISEAVWLRQLVAAALREAAPDGPGASQTIPALPATRASSALNIGGESRRDACTSIRLRPQDRRLLQERAEARSMRSCTYVSVLVRAHLHHL